jgi:hypothetical protein
MQLTYEEDEVILKFPKDALKAAYVQDFLQRLKLEAAVRKSQLSEQDVRELSEEIKRDRWEKNREKFLKRIESE